MEIKVVPFTAALGKKLAPLTEGGSSIFSDWINYRNEDEIPKQVVIAMDGNKIIGWAGVGLTERTRSNEDYDENDLSTMVINTGEYLPLIGVYVSEDARKLGLGEELVRTALKNFKKNSKIKSMVYDDHAWPKLKSLIKSAGLEPMTSDSAWY